MQLSIRLVTGGDVHLDVSPDEIVLALKLRLEDMEGLPVNSLRLLRGDRELKDTETVRGANLAKCEDLLLKTWPSDSCPVVDDALLAIAREQIDAVDPPSGMSFNFRRSPSRKNSNSTSGQQGLSSITRSMVNGLLRRKSEA